MSNSELEALKADILEDGIIDDGEVATLWAKLLDDGVIDQEEADFLFDLNDATSGNANAASWTACFVDCLCSFVLHDDESPGVIDAGEAAYLIEQIQGDGQVDANEKALLIALKTKAQGIDPSLLAFMASVGV